MWHRRHTSLLAKATSGSNRKGKNSTNEEKEGLSGEGEENCQKNENGRIEEFTT